MYGVLPFWVLTLGFYLTICSDYIHYITCCWKSHLWNGVSVGRVIHENPLLEILLLYKKNGEKHFFSGNSFLSKSWLFSIHFALKPCDSLWCTNTGSSTKTPSKTSGDEYKVQEYFGYNPDSYYDFENLLVKYRLEQPVPGVKYWHKTLLVRSSSTPLPLVWSRDGVHVIYVNVFCIVHHE